MKIEKIKIGEQYITGNSFGVISEITKIEEGFVYYVVRGRNGKRFSTDGTKIYSQEINEYASEHFELNGRAHSGPNFDIRIFD